MSHSPQAAFQLGCAAYERGDYAAAVTLLHTAVAVDPEQGAWQHALGLALLGTGDAEGARRALELAIALDPQPQFWINLGVLLKAQGATAQAAHAFEQALQANACDTNAEYNLGNCRRMLGDLAGAARCFASVLARDSEHLHALAALGQCLRQAGRAADALPYLRKAVGMALDEWDLCCELALTEEACGNLENAVALYQQVIAASTAAVSAKARAWYGVGCIRNAAKDFVEARRCFSEAVAMQPDWLEARHNAGQTLFELGYVSEAAAAFRWCGETKNSAVSSAMLAVIIPGDSAAGHIEILQARQEWWKPYGTVSASQPLNHARSSAGSRLRIGYISAFFERDPWMKPVWGVINAHDRERFSVHLFSDCALSAIQHGYRGHADDFYCDISTLGNEAVLRTMQAAKLDVLVDLNGYSSMRRLPLFLAKPAPTVAGWFNYYATSGLPGIDYLIGDSEVCRPSEESFYTERILRVKGSYLAFHVYYPVPTVQPRSVSEPFVFGCLGSQYKITPQVIAAWSIILRGAPESVLLIRNKVLAFANAKADLIRRFASQGIGPERLRLQGPAEHFEFLQTYAQIDVALDTFPYNGGTTTTEAIWQGVPVIGFRGDRWVARTTASLLQAAGLERFVAADVDGFGELAIRYATEAERREELRALRLTMRDLLAASPVCNVTGLAQQMEEHFRSIT